MITPSITGFSPCQNVPKYNLNSRAKMGVVSNDTFQRQEKFNPSFGGIVPAGFKKRLAAFLKRIGPKPKLLTREDVKSNPLGLLSQQLGFFKRGIESVDKADAELKVKINDLKTLTSTFWNDITFIVFEKNPHMAEEFQKTMGDGFYDKIGVLLDNSSNPLLIPSRGSLLNKLSENKLLEKYPDLDYFSALKQQAKEVAELIGNYLKPQTKA